MFSHSPLNTVYPITFTLSRFRRFPKDPAAEKMFGATLSKDDLIQSLLQKPDMVFLLYWWFIFKRQRDQDPRPIIRG